MNSDNFLVDINSYIEKSSKLDSVVANPLSCNNSFNFDDRYTLEKQHIKDIFEGNHSNTTEQGNLLENLAGALFNRIDLVSSFSCNNRDTTLGQIDINLIPIDNRLFDIWGMANDYPKGIIGECKNYSTNKVSRPEIEKTCWRACKGRSLSFFVGKEYTQDAVREVCIFNSQRGSIFKDYSGVFVVPFTLEMIRIVIENELNFAYFIKWAITSSKNNMAIANYL